MNETDNEELEKLKRKKMEEIMNKKEGPEFPNNPVNLTDRNFQEVVNKYPLVVVDFWAGWCAPCKAMEPVIEKLSKKYSGKIVFGKLNVDQNQKIPSKFQVSGIPTLLIMKNGEPVDKIVGMVPKPRLEGRLKKHLD